MTQEITAEIIETPKPKRPELWAILEPPDSFCRSWYIEGPYISEDAARKDIDNPTSIIIRIPGETT